MSINEKIKSFIDSKREDDYWDFKEKWHENNVNLLHDIICLANNRVDEEAYLILGVRDSSYEIIGVENDDNRKNQQNIIDFLNNKSFVGGIRPSIELKTLEIENHEIDVIIIKNSTDTPYFLVSDERDRGEMVRKNAIYTRIKDTNTPKDSCADINHIEFLWKKRFLLTQSPINRIFNMLKNKDDWENSEIDYDKTTYYNKYNPEYTVVLTSISDDLRPEFYSMLMINKNQSYLNVKIKYFETTVFECQATYLDETRYLTTTPKWSFIGEVSIDGDPGAYKYFINNSKLKILQDFLFDEGAECASIAKQKFDDVILYFNSDEEKEKFENFVRNNSSSIEKEIVDKINDLNNIICENPSETKYMRINIARGLILKKKQIEINRNIKQLMN